MNEGYNPGKVCLRAVANILAERRAVLERALDHSGAPGQARAGREQEIDMLKKQLRKMERPLKTKVITRVDPAIVGLLCTWATGHDGALAVLKDYLAGAGHAQAQAVARLQSDDIAAAAGLLVLPPQKGRDASTSL
jgi:hypothetical protein